MRLILLLACVFTCCCCRAQNVSWFTGTWYGETYFPNGPVTKRILVRLTVNEVSGNAFIAQLANMYPNDTTVRLERIITGNITVNNITIANSTETYILDPRTRNFWSDCTQCPAQSSFRMQGDDVMITITTTGCSDVCDGETTFHRNIHTFDSTYQDKLIKLFDSFDKKADDVIAKNMDSATATVVNSAADAQKKDTLITEAVPGKTFPLVTDMQVKKDSLQKAGIVKIPARQERVIQTAPLADKDSLYAAFTQRAINLFNTYKITSPHITIQLFDNAQIDGDVVSVFHNNQLIIDHQTLTHKAITFAMDASANNKHHEFVMVADNLGLLPPNTALLRIIAGNQKYELEISSDMFTNAKIAIDYTGE